MAVNEPVTRRDAGHAESVHASRSWWDAYAAEYQVEHGEFLGDADFLWGPEGLREGAAGLLGDVAGRAVLEVGCGAAQCSRWLARRGARPVAFDLSRGQLLEAQRLARSTRVRVPLVLADAGQLPFRDESFDLAC